MCVEWKRDGYNKQIISNTAPSKDFDRMVLNKVILFLVLYHKVFCNFQFLWRNSETKCWWKFDDDLFLSGNSIQTADQ